MGEMKLIQGKFEMMLRILLEMSCIGEKQTSLHIALYDFIATHGSDFGMESEDLHGAGRFRHAEIVARIKLVDSVIFDLVKSGHVLPSVEKGGYVYQLTGLGDHFAHALTSTYAIEYRAELDEIAKSYSDNTDEQLFRLILDNATEVMGIEEGKRS